MLKTEINICGPQYIAPEVAVLPNNQVPDIIENLGFRVVVICGRG